VANVCFTVDEVMRTRARLVRRGVPDTIKEIEQRCTDAISDMRCPWHQHDAKVVIDGEHLEDLEIEIICCCDRFANRVLEALQKPLNQV
jgi:hypothetical protein